MRSGRGVGRSSRSALSFSWSEGLGPEEPPASEVEPRVDASNESSPRALAERSRDEARRSGDLAREVDALIDLGASLLKNGESSRAAEVLCEAVRASKKLADAPRKADALTHLGMAMLATRRPLRARMLLRPALSHARRVGDPFAEKLVLEHLGIAQIGSGEAEDALIGFDRARSLAAELRDGRQEASVLWRAAILLAEMGRRDRAIASAEAAVGVMRREHHPAAEWYAGHLASFRDRAPSPHPGGSIDAIPASSEGGPGLLRMALTAAKAMKAFVGSGFRRTPPEGYRARLAVCSRCEHHTGIRCRLCGCLTAVKAGMLHERCPAGRWPS